MAYDLYTMYKHNTVRIYHRRGARRWKKVRRINGHAFVAKRFQMAFCDKCEDRIWGLGRQGYRCESCKMTVHKRCCYYLKQDNICKGHPVSGLSLTSLPPFSHSPISVSHYSTHPPYLHTMCISSPLSYFSTSHPLLLLQDIDWVQTEKHVFEQASNHPFLVGLHSCFQTDSRYTITLIYLEGGEPRDFPL